MPAQAPLDAFIEAFSTAAEAGTLATLVLSKNRDTASDLQRLTLRPVQLRGEPRIAIVHRHSTRDLTRHARAAEAAASLRRWLAANPGDAGEAGEPSFGHATLRLRDEELQLLMSRKGRQRLVRRRSEAAATATPAAHDRAKQRLVPIDAPYLHALGVTDSAHRLVPAMARKWKQIDRFVAIFDQAWRRSPLAGAKAMTVVDFGCGKGYLTFAVHDHLRRHGVEASVTGVDRRADLVEACNRLASQTGAEGLEFVEGDLSDFPDSPIDVTIALHACDTATDHALDRGIAAGAAILVASPCCHRELRPQLDANGQGAPLAALLRHGIHLGQQAEMLTDSLRTLALEASGYEASVFEFVALEHTSKNKMILATRRAEPALAAARATAEIDAVKRYWGIREQCLERLVRERAAARA